MVGFESWVTRRSNDFGVDGFVIHADGLIVVQCKRDAPESKVGRPTVQHFKGVVEKQGALRGYIITTSSFTDEEVDSARLSGRGILVGMDALVSWHTDAPKF